MQTFLPLSLLTAAPCSGVLGSTRVAFMLEQVLIAVPKPRRPSSTSMILYGISVYRDTVYNDNKFQQGDPSDW